MKLKVRVEQGDMFYIADVECSTIHKCRSAAIDIACGYHLFKKEKCTAVVIGGIPTSAVSFIIKPITKRRLIATEIEEYADKIGLEPTFLEFSKKVYYWSDAQIEKLKEILKNESNKH